MSIKSIALIALIAVTSASAVTANQFDIGSRLEKGSVLDLGRITADGPGSVEIYNYAGGRRGALLGSESLHAGVNTNVKVNINFAVSTDVIAVLRVNGQEVLTKDYDIRRRR